ncbi:MAG: type 1 glutamine amidotransferase [Saprospiraceae bacterium]|jgi:type 1 glutamine amidotransferase
MISSRQAYILITLFIAITCFFSCAQKSTMTSSEQVTLNALIIDGENNHGIWPMTTMMLKDYLEETGKFTVAIKRKKYTWQGPHSDGDPTIGKERREQLIAEFPLNGGVSTSPVEEPKADPDFNPDFMKYDLVVTNLGWKASDWPEATKNNFEDFIQNGGGLVVIHAANNSWGDWEAYNKMIGVGGWGGRGEDYGNYAYYDKNDKDQRDPSTGPCGSHGAQQEYLITHRDQNHPITKGLPLKWLHTQDELYDRLRGPAENMTILGTAYSDKEKNGPPWAKDVKGSGRHEPMLSAIEFGKGRVFHNAMGHSDYSMECVGFMTMFQRGAEWAATGKVTQTIPSDFPTAIKSSSRKWNDN